MIIICPDEIKNKYLQTNTIHQYKFYNLQEIKEKIYFKYHDLTLYAIAKEFQIKPAIVTEIMKSLYFINENYANKKLQKLSTIYKFLENKNYLEKDPNFLNSLTDEIIIEGYPLTKELNKIISRINDYEVYLYNIYLYLRKHYDIPTIEWLKKRGPNPHLQP